MKSNISWVDAIPKSTDKCEAVILSASTLNEDGTETEYYNRERDGHKELSELLPNPNDIEILNTESYRQEFPGLNSDEIIWSQHQIILKQKIEIAELQDKLNGHLKSIPINY